jgi:hypothetical protein
MLAAIRKHITYANVTMTLALVFAMTGGAYAASRYVINSTKQISPKVVKQLTGKAGRLGSPGPAGPPGAAGQQGVKGESGVAGKEGLEGKEGKQGKEGKEGSPWTIGGTLPKGASETGVWGVSEMPGSFAGGLVEFATASISFGIPLKEGLSKGQVHVIAAGKEGEGGGCPPGSSLANPRAEAGNLCIFQSVPQLNVGKIETKSVETGEEEEAGTTGAILQVKPATTKEPILVSGAWAVAAK